MRINLSTNLKTRTGAPDKDARIKNAYVETRGGQSVVRKRPIAQGGISVATVGSIAQGGIGFTTYSGGSSSSGLFFLSGDTQSTYTGDGTTWSAGTNYVTGDHVTQNWKDYWALDDNVGNSPFSSPTHWSTTYVPAVVPAAYIPNSWTAQALPSSSGWIDICYGGSKYCAISGTSPISATSTNGITWSLGTLPGSLSGYKVIHNGTIFLTAGSATGIYTTATSTDGINWTGSNSLANNGEPWAIAWSGSIFCAIGVIVPTTISSTSADGLTWNNAGTISGANWTALTYGGGLFVAVGLSTTIAYSSDGLTWNYVSGGVSSTAIAYGNGRFVSVPRNGSISKVSTNGTSWTSGTLPASAFWGSIAFNGDCFVAIGAYRVNNGIIAASSTDGINWTSFSMPSSQEWSGIASNGHDFCAVAYNTAIGATTP